MSSSNPYAPTPVERPLAVESEQAARSANPWAVLALLAATHFLVDIVAGTTSPLWPALEESMQLASGGLLWVFVIWSISNSFSQLLFGWWADRYHSRWLIWCGPLLGILSINCIGLMDSPFGLAALFTVGGLGIAAFHPEAAATAGSLLPKQRSRAMAIFALSGYLGQSAGPYYSGVVTDQFGLGGLIYGMAWALPILFVLWAAFRYASPTAASPQTSTKAVAISGRDLPVIGLLLAVGALRILPALGVPLALAYLLKSSDASNALVGAVQSAFMAGIGVGAIGCAALVKRQQERRVLWVFPLCASPLLAWLSFVEGWTLVGLVFASGLLLGITMPVYISYGQQLLPHGQRVASSITMGVSWGIGGGIVAAAIWVCKQMDALSSIFMLFAAASLMSGVLCCLLPVPDGKKS